MHHKEKRVQLYREQCTFHVLTLEHFIYVCSIDFSCMECLLKVYETVKKLISEAGRNTLRLAALGLIKKKGGGEEKGDTDMLLNNAVRTLKQLLHFNGG